MCYLPFANIGRKTFILRRSFYSYVSIATVYNNEKLFTFNGLNNKIIIIIIKQFLLLILICYMYK